MIAQTGCETRSRKYRIALYSHDTMGFGHIRRNLLIAQSLSSSLQAEILLICGSREAGAFALPAGVDCLTLPAIFKNADGQYQSRNLRLSLDELISFRSSTICAAVEAFEPDVLIVDNVPRGAHRELDKTLQYIRTHGDTRCILGLRDVLDDPAAVYNQWTKASNFQVIRDYYDSVWVYGDPVVYDMVREYRFPTDVAAKMRYVGYLDQRVRFESVERGNANRWADLNLPPGRMMLCTLGGGQDGIDLAEYFADCDLPEDANGLLVTGPYMPVVMKRSLRRRLTTRPNWRMFEFITEASLLMGCADRVISMGGYNTIGEVLSFGKRALIIPRVSPRREQLIRAERLRDLGLIDMIHPDQMSSQALTQWLAKDSEPAPSIRNTIDLNGLARLPILVRELLSQSIEQPAVSRRYESEMSNASQ